MFTSSFCRSLLSLAAVGLVGCGAQQDGGTGDDTGGATPLVVPLQWNPGAGDTNWEEARAGLWWALSNLGAAPPDDEAGLTVESEGEDGVAFRLDIDAVGFPDARRDALLDALASVQAAAARDGRVDLGRFLMAVLYDPAHYYPITGACPTLDAWRERRQAADPFLYAITLSLLVDGDRLVALNPVGTDVRSLAYAAFEGEGSLADGDFAVAETEVLDVFPTGQQRYAVYDADGVLVAAAATTIAGQPGKCMWCHETTLQRGTAANPGVPGYLTSAAFLAEIDAAETVMTSARTAAPSAVRWDEPIVHEWAERLTRSFLEPSAEHVAREWGMPLAEVVRLGLPTHTNAEYPELGPLYSRADVDAAWAAAEPDRPLLPVPPSDRELAADWPLGALSGCVD